MATPAKINIKNIDYFKFKKFVIDGNRDDYGSFSAEVKALCDSVQTLTFRDEEFHVETDRRRFEEIRLYYRQILSSKRIEAVDMRIKNGWWAENKSDVGGVCSANKFKVGALKVTLVSKARDWFSRHGVDKDVDKLEEQIDGPGVYVFKHREHQCFQFVDISEKVFASCSEKLKGSFDGTLAEPLASLLVISMASDWDFYFISTSFKDDPRVNKILQNDTILKHDSIWPRGLNFSLTITSPLDLSEFRKSCQRHHWPPECDLPDKSEINLERLRQQIVTSDKLEALNVILQINGNAMEENDFENVEKVTTNSASIKMASNLSSSVKGNISNSQSKPKPPPSPRQTRAKPLSLLQPKEPVSKSRVNSASKSPAPKSPATKSPVSKAPMNRQTHISSKTQNRSGNNCSLTTMSVSLDAAKLQQALQVCPTEIMTSSLCAQDLERVGVLTDLSAADDVMNDANNDCMTSHEPMEAMTTSKQSFSNAVSETNLTVKTQPKSNRTNIAIKDSHLTLRPRAQSATDVRKRAAASSAKVTTAPKQVTASASAKRVSSAREAPKRPSSARVAK